MATQQNEATGLRRQRRPHLWLAAAVGATVVMVAMALSLPTPLARLSFFLGTLASIPLVAWFLALRGMTRLGDGWPRAAWSVTALLAYVSVGLIYATARWVILGGVGAWTVPLLWPSVAVVDAAYALGLTTGTVGN